MQNKRVLIFDTFSRAGGGIAYLKNIAEAFPTGGNRWEWIFYCNPAIRGRINELEQVCEVHYGPEILRHGGFSAFLHRKKILREVVEKFKPDVVISMNMLDATTKIPSILFLRNQLYFSINDHALRVLFPARELLRCWILQKLTLGSIRRANWIVTSTDAFRKYVLSYTPSIKMDISVVPFGCNNQTLSGNDHDYYRKTREVLFLQYNFYKGLDVALRAVKYLHDIGCPVRLTVTDNLASKKSHKAAILKKMMDGLELHDKVIFKNKIDQHELRTLYAETDVFWFPSYMESFGHGLLEAMANGLPCVATDIGSFREIGGESVKYFPSGDYRSLAATTAQLFDDERLRIDLGNKARVRARKFSWSNHVRRMEEELDSVQQKMALPKCVE